ncbi:MAG: NCS2 family permease [Candidatus Doudnabacteria bacterium]|nr:NCS2 family permease [Candidatus Doudnabacteria bacterium]
MKELLEKVFSIDKLKSSLKVEVLAGISTFLSLSYIFVVNPAILSAAGIPKSAAFFATIVGSVVTTLAMGLWANKPFAVAPGLEMNAYVAFVVVGSLGFSWQGAMGAVFWSGVLTVILSLTSLRVNIIKAIPDKLKFGLSASVGVFLMLIALKVSNLTAYQGIQIIGLGKIVSKEALVFLVGLALVLVLKKFKVKGSVLISIIGASVLANLIGSSQSIEPIKLGREMFSGTFALDLSVILNPKIWSVVIILFILDFYGSIAKFIGLTQNTLIVDEQGNLPKMKEALIIDGAGTVLGASLGTSNLITFVESAVGIGEGGRTGLVAVVCGVLMSLFLFLTPLVNLVPVVATAGALFFVGWSLLPKLDDVKKYTWAEIVSLAAMILVTIWTFGLDKAMFAGFVSFTVFGLIVNFKQKPNYYLWGSTIVLLVSILLS